MLSPQPVVRLMVQPEVQLEVQGPEVQLEVQGPEVQPQVQPKVRGPVVHGAALQSQPAEA
mgnify:CR=1 FL=1|jgi:hypothetical protein